MAGNAAARQKHWEIAADLRALIEAGDLPPGEKLPSVSRLMEQYDVFSQTVQNAVAMLRAEGLVESKQGRGMFVLPPRRETVMANAYLDPAADGQPYPWMTDAASHGKTGAAQLLEVGETVAPQRVAAALNLDQGARVVWRWLLMLLDDSPAELVKLYYSADLARGTVLAEPKKIKGGTPRALTELGVPPVDAWDDVSARPPTGQEYDLLQLAAETPVLRTFRVVYTAGGRPVEVQDLVKASGMYSVRYHVISVKCPRCEAGPLE